MAGSPYLRRTDTSTSMGLSGDPPPVAVPAGYVGPVFLSHTGRMVWWTGRVAIGLLHQPNRFDGNRARSSTWMQTLLIDNDLGARACAGRRAA